MTQMHTLLALSLRHPVFSIAFTLLCWVAALRLHYRYRWVPPLVAVCIPILLLLQGAHISTEEYDRGGKFINWLLGPATVALAVPMYKHGARLRHSLPRLALAVLIGSVVGMATAGGVAWLLGAPMPVVMATVPKSVTTPIAIEITRQLHGIPQITVAMVVLAGILGSIVGPPLLRLARIHDDRAIGVAIGTSAHGVGTASLMHRSELQASVSSWAMAAAGVFTSLLAAVLALFFRN